jgi:hypothetical protein
MLMTGIFPVIILNGRPAAGKSELLAYLRALPGDTRRERYHVGQLHEIDDFPMLWIWFEEDALLEQKFGHPRLYTTPDGYFLNEDLWHLLIERMDLDYAKLVRDDPDTGSYTTLIEFSRGTEHGGYRKAYAHLSEAILRQAAIFYIDVPYEESLRKNRRRFNPDKPDSILEHGLSDEKLTRLYKEVDWEQVSAGSPETITINGIDVPYAVFPNGDDVTTTLGEVFEQRLEQTFDTLWERYTRLHAT